MSSQTCHQSMVEALTGTAIGFVIALASQFFMMWMYDLPAKWHENILITVFFTGVSIIRGYLVRRWFNRRHA